MSALEQAEEGSNTEHLLSGQDVENNCKIVPTEPAPPAAATAAQSHDSNSPKRLRDAEDDALQQTNSRVSQAWKRCQHFMAGLSPQEMCPTLTWLHILVTRLEVGALLGALVYVVVSLPWAESVRTPILQLSVLGALAWTLGFLAELVNLPPLLGMLLAGLVLKNTHYFEAEGNFIEFAETLRVMAFTVILLKAGLGLDAPALRQLSMVVLRLAVCPCVIEATTVGVVSHFLLNFPWLWGLLLGFVLAAVSPAVVVPSLLELKAQGYGEDKGISTLVIAASSLDDIIAVSMFGVFLSVIFSHGSLVDQLLQGPIEVLFGLLWGIVMGVISIYIPHRDDDFVATGRLLMVGGSGLLAVLGSRLIKYPGAGPLACITCAFVACSGWKSLCKGTGHAAVMEQVSGLWLIFQPVLFGLIGTEINLSTLDARTVAFGLIVLVIGLTVRMCVSVLAVQGGGLSVRETFFVAVAWFPKATVQAALGPVALDHARHLASDGAVEEIKFAHDVLTVAVLSILITAPLGAIGIKCFGPHLLNRSETSETLAQTTFPSTEESQDRTKENEIV